MLHFLLHFWMGFPIQKHSKIAQKAIKNQAKTATGLKKQIFRKIAPRLGETLFWGVQAPQNTPKSQPKTLQKPNSNPTKISVELYMDF